MKPKLYICRRLGYYIVVLLLLARPVLAQEYATSQTSNVTGLLCLGCGVKDPDNAVKQDDLDDYAVFYLIGSVLNATIQQTLIFSSPGSAGDSLYIRVGCANALISANLFGCVNVQTFNGNTPNSDGQFLAQPALRILEDGSSVLVTLKPPQAFDRVKITLHSTLLGLLTGFRVYWAKRITQVVPPPHIIPDSLTICAGDTATFQVNDTTATIRWYNAPTDGNLLATGNTFTALPDSNVIYYAEAEKGGKKSLRSPATVIVHRKVLPLTISMPDKVVAGNTAQYAIVNPQPGITYRWYRSDSSLQNLVATDTIYKTEPLADTLTKIVIYVEAIDLSTGCSRPMVKITTPIVSSTCGPAPDKSQWSIKYVSSEETTNNRRAIYAIDNDPNTFWHSQWRTSPAPTHPHEIQIDLGGCATIRAIGYLPRQDANPNGTITDYELYTSSDGNIWDLAATGTWPGTEKEERVTSFPPRDARYVRLRSLASVGLLSNDTIYASAAEINVYNVPPAAVMSGPIPGSRLTYKRQSLVTATLYPNPASSFINVAMKEGKTLPLPYRILNAQGRMTQVGWLTNNINSISITTHIPGIYFMSIGAGERKETLRFVIQ